MSARLAPGGIILMVESVRFHGHRASDQRRTIYQCASNGKGVQMEWHEHIHSDPKILSGKPVIKGKCISVELLLGLLAEGWTEEQIYESYPHLTPEVLRAVFAFACQRTPTAQDHPS